MEGVHKLARLLEAATSVELLPGDAAAWAEIAGPDNEHAPFVFIDGNLGIPEKDLFKVYYVASKAFSKLPLRSLFEASGTSNASEAGLLELTSVILLANSAHQTALNVQKTLVLNGRRTCQDELKFTATVLTLKQSSKVSMLWHHRRWLLLRQNLDGETQALPLSVTDIDFVTLKLPSKILADELQVCSSACETYPRNYYAWFHRYLCLRCCATRAASDSAEHASLLEQEKNELKRWINLHVSDHSAVHCLFVVIEALLAVLTTFSDAEALVMEIRDHALQLLQSYPSHENLWLYFRRAFEQWVTNPATGRVSIPPARTAEDEAKILMNTHKRSSVGKRSDEDKLVVDHARCYLTWKGGKWKSGGSDTPRSLTGGDRM
ncbi:protein prenylyltransferase [Schizopora paradoxa]|uniref:Protein prenylyltransferase n=1 Tax=Schizopora paradoxa TaxID=27342 RepID=A0A0H2S276_9AGAM|nr:protein prenylyltransferase [Schizopora paradoxa]